MAGIDGNIGGQQPIRPSDTGQAQRAGQVGQTAPAQSTDTNNLSISRTDGQQQASSRVYLGGIPAPDPSAVGYLGTQNPSDLQSLLSNLNAEVNQTQDEFAVSNAEARNNEVKETQDARKKELEKLADDKSSAEKTSKCVDVKTTFAKIFSLGISTTTNWHKDQMATKADAQMKLVTIDLQEKGLIDIPAPALPPVLDAISRDYFAAEGDIIKNNVGDALTGKDWGKKAIIDNINNGLQTEHNAQILSWLEQAGSPADFHKMALMSASRHETIAERLQSTPVPESFTEASLTGVPPPQQASGSVPANDNWERDFAALMNSQEEEMNEIIAQLGQAEQSIVGSAQDGYDIAAFRFTQG